MSELRKADGDLPYFITIPVVGWVDVFTRNCYCDEIIKNLEYCRAHKGLRVFAYCIMSNHIHLVVSQDQGKLPSVLRDFKSYTAKRIIDMIQANPTESRQDWMLHLFKYFARYGNQNSTYQFWQKTSHPVELHSNHVFDQKVNYIHYNPVKAMLVNDQARYVYSSANPESPFKVDES